jgi:KDO2-lipid IV(A) lauroyltransferase
LGAERLPGGRGFRIHIEPLTAALDGDPAHDAAAINRGIERMIVRFPAQYLWGYNRYKTPAGAAAAPGAGVEAQ